MRNLPRRLALSFIALPAALLLSACGGDSASTSGTPTGNSAPSTPLPQQAAAPNQGNTPATPGEPQPQADAGNDAIQPSDYKPDPTYLPDDSHLGKS